MTGYARSRILGVGMLILWFWMLHFTEDVLHLGLADWCQRMFGPWNGIGVWAIGWLVAIILIFIAVMSALARK